MTRFWLVALAVAVVAVAVSVRLTPAQKEKRVDNRVFELRIYHAAPGKMKALHARFRDHTWQLFPSKNHRDPA
jgi:hypothetical protein